MTATLLSSILAAVLGSLQIGYHTGNVNAPAKVSRRVTAQRVRGYISHLKPMSNTFSHHGEEAEFRRRFTMSTVEGKECQIMKALGFSLGQISHHLYETVNKVTFP